MKLLFTAENDTMDEIFQVRGNGDWDGYVGGRDIGVKPHPGASITGPQRLRVPARGHRRPRLHHQGAGSAPPPARRACRTVDHLAHPARRARRDPVLLPQRRRRGRHPADLPPVSEPAYLDATVSRSDGAVAGKFTVWTNGGSSSSSWNGRDSAGPSRRRWGVPPVDAAARQGRPHRVRALREHPHPVGAQGARRDLTRDLRSRPGRPRESTTLRSTLTKPARLSYLVTDANGNKIVAAGGAYQGTGYHSWTWSGTDSSGRFVPTGLYRAMITASTSVGTASHVETVFVGAFRVYLSDGTPGAGQSLVVTTIAVEPMARAPMVIVQQPGQSQYTELDHRGGRQQVRDHDPRPRRGCRDGLDPGQRLHANGQTQWRTMDIAFH